MPRIILKRRPSARTDSPGLSSVPASIEPIMTEDAPAASAFTTSPEYLMPPSAMTGTSSAPRTASMMAVIWGTPTPVTTRVVQMLPGPMPTFTASTPRRTISRAPASVATLPATSCTSGKASRSWLTVRSTPSLCPCAESTTSTSTPASISAGARGRWRPVRRRPPPRRAAGRAGPCWRSGCSRRLKMSLTVISPLSTPCASTTGSFSMRCFARIRSASSRLVPTGAVTRLSLVIASRIGWSRLRSNWRSRLVMMPMSRPCAVHDRHARDLEPPHERVRLAERPVGPERDRVQDHPALAALDPVDLGRLALDGHVLVKHADAAGPRHGDGHVGLGDGVHGGGDERNVQGDGAGEAAAGRDLARMNGRIPRHEEDVVEGEAGLGTDDAHALVARGSAGDRSIHDGPPRPGRAVGRPEVSGSITKCRAGPREIKRGPRGSPAQRLRAARRQSRYTGMPLATISSPGQVKSGFSTSRMTISAAFASRVERREHGIPEGLHRPRQVGPGAAAAGTAPAS